MGREGGCGVGKAGSVWGGWGQFGEGGPVSGRVVEGALLNAVPAGGRGRQGKLQNSDTGSTHCTVASWTFGLDLGSLLLN